MSLLEKLPFGKRSQAGDDAAAATAAPAKTSSGKGRPTPKRKDAQARNLHPIVPADRKAAKREARAKQDEAWERQRIAMQTGDERYLPPRDKGPIKRYIRDYIDARYSLGELFMPLTLVLLIVFVAFSSRQTLLSFYFMLAIYLFLFISIADAVICWRLLRRRLYAKFGREKVQEQGHVFWYIFSRCFNLRRWRQPAPQVARRQYPE
ncbi:DUF3043 domain-containing protein [Actinomyces ruminicola]|uniref:DUF3043 domain-containing protein n=1 Tax=Actinomyces ruminicola TaxID=332524 RepID=A0A1G9VUJ9_9ACTO|nr:DUF3043 domain-containing protein [Actinomyces ruminicola]SDM75820.1 Protein of unknown function [Actinomyces ruminicola]